MKKILLLIAAIGVSVNYEFIPELKHNPNPFMSARQAQIISFISKYLVNP